MEEIRKAGQGKCEDVDREGTETPPRSVSRARTQYFAMRANGGGNFAGTEENGQHVSAGQAQQQTAQT